MSNDTPTELGVLAAKERQMNHFISFEVRDRNQNVLLILIANK